MYEIGKKVETVGVRWGRQKWRFFSENSVNVFEKQTSYWNLKKNSKNSENFFKKFRKFRNN